MMTDYLASAVRFLFLSFFHFAVFARLCNAQEPIKIGAILHLTGDLAMQGAAFREGIELAVDQINSKGGVSGRPLKIIFEDSGFNTSSVHRAAKKLIDHDKVAAGLISTFHESKTAGPIFERAQIPLLCLWDSTPELDDMGEYLFSIGTWLPSTPEKTSQFALSELKAKRAAVVSTNREWSLRVGDDFARLFQEGGGKVVFKDSYNPGQSDFRSLFLRIRQTSPDVMYAPVDDNIAAFFKQLRESGMKIPVIESDNLNQEWIDNLGEVLEGVYQSHSIDPDHPAALQLAEDYQDRFGKKASQLLFHGWGYDAVNLLAQAIKSDGPNPDQIRSGLYKVKNYPGTIGNITIGEGGSHRVGVSIFQIENGKFALRVR